jgi:hypothetical protein
LRHLRTLVAAMVMALPLPALAETYLLMAEEHGCMWCARWNEEISGIYPKTREGQAAPLRRFDIRQGDPDDVSFASDVRFTPTFILVRDGTEVGRIEGYPGEDFFWGLLELMLRRAGVQTEKTG